MKKIAIVTGSTSGIGRATAIRFAHEGYTVVVTGRNSDRGTAVYQEISQNGGDAQFISADLTDKIQAQNLINRAAELGKLDVLVNNAGGNNGQQLETEMATNFFSAVYCTEFAIEKMTDGGCIINVASICGCSTRCNDVVYYSSAKAAMLNYAKNLAKSLAPSIRVNSILPGYTRTPDWGDLTPEKEKLFSTDVPLQRFIEPKEVAEAIWSLAQNRAITGAELVIDGGLTLR